MACPEQTKDPVAYSCKIADTFSLASLYWSPVSICLFRQGRPECFEHNGALMCSLSPPWRPSRLSVWHKEGCKLLSFHSHFNHQWMGVHLKMGSTNRCTTHTLSFKKTKVNCSMYDNNSSRDRHLFPRVCSPLTSTLPVFLLPTSGLRNVFLVAGSNPTFAFHLYLYAASLSAIPYSLRWRCTWESFYKYSTPFWHSIDRW